MALNILVSTVVVMCIASFAGASTPYIECTEGLPPLELRVDGCTETPCLLYRGYDVTAEWDFLVTADTDKLTPRVRATVLGLTTTYPLGQDDACETLTNAECPLDEEEEVTYRLTMPVLSSYPRISLTIEFAFLDDSGDVQLCFRLPARVADL